MGSVIQQVFDPFERFFSSVAIVLLLFSAILYIYNGNKKEILYEKILMYGFASFWLSISLFRSFFYIVDYSLGDIYYGNLTTIIDSYNTISYILLYFYLYFYIYMFIDIIILIIIFIWFSIKAEKEFQAISSLVTIGFSMILIGWAFDAVPIREINIIFPFMPPIFIIIGTIAAIFPLMINLEFFSKSLANWLVIVLVIGVLLFVGLTVFTNLPLIIISQIIIWVSSFVLITVITYLIIKLIKRRQTPESPAPIDKGELKDTIKIFTRPATITIEEIQLYKEKGLCLVCKGKISGINYSCPKCNSLYCLKCSDVLANLENKCWVCETPFKLSKKLQDEA